MSFPSNDKSKKSLAKTLLFFCFALSGLPLLGLSNQVIAKDNTPTALQPPPPQQLNIVLQTELLAMQQAVVKLHQETYAYPNGRLPNKLINEITKTNRKNSLRLLDMIKVHGWLNTNIVGIKGRDAALVIVQQSEPSIQESLLSTLQNEFKQGLLSGQKLATLIDTMLIKSGKKQRYGTQLAIVNGQIVFNEIEDEKNVDQRRIKMNMLPMQQYKNLLNKMYQLD